MTEGTVPVPYTTPALSEDDGAPVRGLSHRGATAAGVKALERMLLIEHFSRVDSFFKRDMNRSSSHTHQEIGRYRKEPAFIFLVTERGK
jgi:hypothetical protein